MSKKLLSIWVLLLLNAVSLATQPCEVDINPQLLKQRWPAHWISCPDVSLKDYGVYHFRRVFDLSAKPEKFIIHVSADNRYWLFVNGNRVCSGPARGDLVHWRFETVDIAPSLQKGKNVIAAVVWNFGEYIPFAQVTHVTAFLLQGDTDTEAIVNTNDKWKVVQNQAYSPVPVDKKRIPNFIVVGPGDRVDASKYPWGWQQIVYDDSGWQKPRDINRAVPRQTREYSTPWALIPRMIPFMEDRLQRIPKIAKTDIANANDGFLKGTKDLKIPANTNGSILLDQSFLTTAYPQLLVSGGKESQITLTYAEGLFSDNRSEKYPYWRKGNRNEIEGRHIIGYQDKFLPDGGSKRLFQPLWFRTYRYLQMDIKTAEEGLVIHDFHGRYTAYPFTENATVASSDSSLNDIWNVGWRTARLCAGETYFDCPYYEQLQYVGDTRIQALISLYVSGDDRLMRKAIKQFDDSRIPDGLTASRYPHCAPQTIPPYSLFWVAMVHDYWMHRDDTEFVQSFLPGIRGVLEWFEQRIDDDTGMLGPLEWWNFVDWVRPYRSGEPPSAKTGNCAVITLQYAYVLNYAAQLAVVFNKPVEAEHYYKLAQSLKRATFKHCWDNERGLLADSPAKKQFSQHTNIMAVLVDIIPRKQQKSFMEKVASEPDLIQCTFYYRFYLTRAMNKAGLGDRYIAMLEPWRDMLKIGLTTFAERPEPARSDCHAWSASPNYELLATVCGIMPAEPGFRSVRIEPFLGPLTWVEGRMPHPLGEIKVKFKRKGDTGIEGKVTLPEGLAGQFVWQGKLIHLKSGQQKIER